MSDTMPSFDRIRRILADAERRQLLVVLRDLDRCVPLAVVVEQLADRLDSSPESDRLGDHRESDGSSDRIDSTRVPHRQLRVRLHHNHLPRLAAADLVEYNADVHLVRPAPHLPDVVDRFAPSPDRATSDDVVLGLENR